jgi:uncharacterized protein YycO
MQLLSISSHGPAAYFIKLFTFSKWNHSAIYFEDMGIVIDSTFKTGVRTMGIESYLQRYPDYDISYIEVPDLQAAKDFAFAQVGKPYDWTAIFGLVFRNSWEEPDSWFCSELAEAIIKAGGLQRFRDYLSKLVPKEIWAVK